MSKLTFGEERVGINFNPSQKGEVLGEERVIGRKVDIPLLEELHAIGNQMLASLRLL